MNEHLQSNQSLWNAWANLHAGSEFYDVEGFIRGENRLDELELAIGDVRGKSLLHLQCHFGLGTLSWGKLGAIATGVDFSENAITIARQLSTETGIPATFILSDIYDLENNLNGEFDFVFTSHGVLGWLPDLTRWGEIIAHFCRPGGVFYIVEAHPFAMVFENEGDVKDLKINYPYFHLDEPFRFETQGSYAVPEAEYRGIEYGWNHSMSDITNSLIDAGMRIDYIREYPFVAWRMFPFMERDDRGWWHLPDNVKPIPLMFALHATRVDRNRP